VVGDSLSLSLGHDEGAHVLYTTPSAGKVYAAPPGPGEQVQSVEISASGAVVEWLPQETIIFDHARARLDLTLHIDSHTSFFVWDILVLGRTAGAQPFLSGYCHQTVQVFCGRRLLWRERNRFDAQSPMLSERWGLHGATVSGTLAARSPKALGNDVIDQVRELCPALAVTHKKGLLIARYLGHNSEHCRNEFERFWQYWRDTQGRPAVRPRIWNT